MAYAVLPPLFSQPRFVPSYAFEMNVRSAAIIGYVGAGGIGASVQPGPGLRPLPAGRLHHHPHAPGGLHM
jgi:ABC-type phosphate/phosphonate transport system permease subunit